MASDEGRVTRDKGQGTRQKAQVSDLSQSKLRPAVVLADAGHGDWIPCQLTSSPYFDVKAVRLMNTDFKKGSLRVISYARPGKLFTANQELLVSEVGVLRPDK